ncbi:MAG: UDP-2,3-diacylglucosamine diphosphatase [Candidatus Thiodiazotropha sp.]
MSEALFISDLHLSADDADRVGLFLQFLETRARSASSVYILGDLFDAWVGDDDQRSPIPAITRALRRLTDSGVELLLMHGNRDFLIGDAFCEATGARLLPDPCLIDLHGTPTLLMHGDLLCTDDLAYQQFRAQVRAPQMIQHFLSLPIDQRFELARQFRQQSGEANATKAEDIMDVNDEAVRQQIEHYGAARLIHGHTHRPAEHRLQVADREVLRYVLAEWRNDRGEALVVTQQGLKREPVLKTAA